MNPTCLLIKEASLLLSCVLLSSAKDIVPVRTIARIAMLLMSIALMFDPPFV